MSTVEYGRLVDIYSYRRFTASNGQRRDVRNRVPTLIQRDVVVDPRIESQPLFDSVGEEDANADYQFRPFDATTGHDQLMILWDDRHPEEQARFQAALARAQGGLVPVAAAYSGQNTTVQPIPVVPRNAALKLKFTRTLGVDRSFFVANPAALQILEIVDDPRTAAPERAFRALPYRVLIQNDTLVLDPSLVGGEVTPGGKTSSGLPNSRNNVAANIRIAIPTQTVGAGLGVKADNVAQLNGNDRAGLPSVIRDFRTGNAADGRIGTLVDVEAPMVVVDVPMGITAIDAANRVITLNKRGAKVAVRGQIPFVVGPLAVTGLVLPLGPAEVPILTPLRSGDFIMQTIATPAGNVRVRAEVVMNLDVHNTGTLTGNPNLGRLLTDPGSDGGDAETVRVLVSSLSVTAEDGTSVAFAANNSPLGADCIARVHYYEHVPYSSGSYAVSDAGRRAEFVTFDPATPRIDPVTRQPIPLGTRIQPAAAVSVRFSEPLDFDTVDRAGNVFLANRFLPARDSSNTFDVVQFVNEPKAAAQSMIGTIPEDFQRDGTVVRLNLPMGHTHESNQAETYWLHLLGGNLGPKDLAGNGLEIYDRRVGRDQVRAFSLSYTLEPTAPSNLVGVRMVRFDSDDEDGTRPGSPDFFGQFELRDGQIFAAPVTRFNKVADQAHLQSVVRGPNGECFFTGVIGAVGPPAVPPQAGAHITWGPLYTTNSMIQTTGLALPPNPFMPPQIPGYVYGGIGGPHNARGVREQVTYREDDFGLGYHDADTMLIDVEQLYWSPWTNRPVLFDQFDRYTLRLGHSKQRPDLRAKWVSPGPPNPSYCGVDCASLFSGLSNNFDDNPLNGVMIEVVKDKAYTIDPADSFRSGTTDNVYTPFPRFTRTFTWRDSRLVSWDRATDAATGLGGATDPTQATIPPKDTTTDVSSPWETDVFPNGVLDRRGEPPPWPMGPVPTASGYMVNDPGDFSGVRQRDHDPIALPMLVEFNVWPDDRSNGAVVGSNYMHIAYVGINGHQSPWWGYFNLGVVPPPPPAPAPWNQQDITPLPSCAGLNYPSFTVFTGGSVDAVGSETFIDPSRERVARGSIILDAGSPDTITGLVAVPPANDHLYWAQADFVRRVSMCTFGFFDTLRPNRHEINAQDLGVRWPGLDDLNGFPDFQSDARRRVVDMIAIMDPPPERQPAGTTVLLEVRGAETFDRAEIWNRSNNNRTTTRNNLLNPSYACDAYRYAMPNPGEGSVSGPRVGAEGLTPYADLERLDRLRSPITQLLPRFVNFRLVFENDISVNAPKQASLRSLALVYRVKVPD